MKKIVILLLVSIFLFGHSCNEDELDKAEYFANSAAAQIVNSKFDGGSDIYANVISCKYNPYSQEYTLKIEIHWNGAIFKTHHYECDGTLRIQSDGTNPNFTIEWMNDRLQSYVSDMNLFKIVVGGIIVLNALDQQQN